MTPPSQMSVSRQRLVQRGAFVVSAVLCGVGFSPDAVAQLTKVTNALDTISTWMQGLGVTVFPFAVIWAGIKIIFGHQQMKDLGNIFWGAFLISGASPVASFFFSGTSS